MTLHSIITDLTENGAHVDCVNKRGETPLDSSATGIGNYSKNYLAVGNPMLFFCGDGSNLL